MNTYTTNGVCSQAIQFEIKDNKVINFAVKGAEKSIMSPSSAAATATPRASRNWWRAWMSTK